jgi:hypothetical protein
MRYLLHVLPYAKKDAERIGPVDTLLVGRAQLIEFRAQRRLGAAGTATTAA